MNVKHVNVSHVQFNISKLTCDEDESIGGNFKGSLCDGVMVCTVELEVVLFLFGVFLIW